MLFSTWLLKRHWFGLFDKGLHTRIEVTSLCVMFEYRAMSCLMPCYRFCVMFCIMELLVLVIVILSLR